MKKIAGLIHRVLSNLEDEAVLTSVREDVKELVKSFPLYPQYLAVRPV
jgi:glycine/serine hydroxymethyltransferase